MNRARRILIWLYEHRLLPLPTDPGRVPWAMYWFHEFEDRRCHRIPIVLARYGLVEVDGNKLSSRPRSVEIEGERVTVLPSDRFQHDAPIGTFRIYRFDASMQSWLVYR